MEDVWLTAHLAVFNVLLSHSGRGINAGFIPFTTSGALEACGHDRVSMITVKKAASLERPAAALLNLPLTNQ
jgi:hypothetical protein